MPGSLRRPAAWLAGLAAVAVAVLGIQFAGLTGSTPIDETLVWAVDSVIPENARGLWRIQQLGNPRTVIMLAVVLAVVALILGRRRLAVLAVLGPGLTGLSTTLLKPVFDRTFEGDLAYPSGHTAGLTALAIVAALLLVSVLRTGVVGTTLVVAVGAVGAGLAMAVSLTAREEHYPTDTLGGFGTAVAVVIAAALVLDRVAEFRTRSTLR